MPVPPEALEDWDYPRPFVHRAVVTAQDIDSLEHTNNTVYVRWCEEAAWEHSAALGLGIDDYRRLDRAMAVVEGSYRYLRASYLGDLIDTATWIESWDQRLTMTRHFQQRRVADGCTLLRATVRFACIELSTGRPRRLPEEFITGYGVAVLDSDTVAAGRAS